jgi:hypothetical protein
MDIIEAIIQKSQTLPCEHQLEVLRYIESLSEKVERHDTEERKNETINMRFKWAGALAELNQTANGQTS